MEDVTARIIVTAESSMAVQGLNNVRKALDDVTEARLKDLQLEKAKAQLELSEFESARAAEKAYAAEIPLRGAEKQLDFLKEQHQAHIELYRTKKQLNELDKKQDRKWVNALKKEAAEIDNLKGRVQELTKTYLPLANAEAGANLAAFNAKQKLDALSGSTGNAGNNVKKFSGKMLAARVASRVFGMDLGATSDNMIKYGIIAAGAASAIKLVAWGFEQMDKPMIENAAMWKRNNENMKETAAGWAEQRQKQNEALEALKGYNDKTELSSVEQLKMAESLKVLKQGFGDLGIEIDHSTGKIANFDKVSAAYQRKMIDREKSEIQAQIKNLENEKRAQVEIRDTAGVPIWGGDTRIGGEEVMLAAGKEIDRIASEQSKLRKRLSELNRLNPEKDSLKLKNAQWEDASRQFERRQNDLAIALKVQTLRNQGLEREAKLLELNAKLDKERLGLQNDQQRAEFDRRRSRIVDVEMEKYDIEQTEPYRKQMAQRINDMNVALKIQNLRNQGLEREAKLLELNAKLDKERLGIKNEQQRAIFDNNRQKIIDIEMAKYDTPTSRNLDIFKALNKYRATTQSAVDANSLEGWRLQSRRLTSANMGDPQKSSAESLKTVVKQGAETNAKLDNLARQLAAITSGGVKITAATRKY